MAPKHTFTRALVSTALLLALASLQGCSGDVGGTTAASGGETTQDDDDGGGGTKPDPDPAPLGLSLPLFDDFTTHQPDAQYRWRDTQGRSFEVAGGRLTLGASLRHQDQQGTPTVAANLNTPLGVPVGKVEATVTLNDLDLRGARGRVLVALYYQPEEDRGTDKNLLAMRIGLRADGDGQVRLRPQYFMCEDEACEDVVQLPNFEGYWPWGLTAEHDEPVKISVEHDPDEDVFVMKIDGYTATVDATLIPGFDPANFLYAQLRVDATLVDDLGETAMVRALFDDVWVDGELYDDFSGDHIDSARWASGTFVSELRGGRYVSAQDVVGERRTAQLRVQAPAAVSAMYARSTVHAYEHEGGGSLWARLGGLWYSDGSAGDGEGGANGQIFAGIGLTGDDARYMLARCTSADCSSLEPLAEESLGPNALEQERQLYVAWDGSVFTFQLDAEEPIEVDPSTVGAAPDGVGEGQARMIGTSFRNDGADSGHIEASFDDVRVGPADAFTVSLGDVDASYETTAVPATASNPVGLDPLLTSGAVYEVPSNLEVAIDKGVEGGVCGAGCERLSLEVLEDDVVEGGPIELVRVRYVRAGKTFRLDAASTTSTLELSRADAVGGRLVGTYSVDVCAETAGGVDCDDALTLSGSFDVPRRPWAFPPPTVHAAHSPGALRPGCARDPFCWEPIFVDGPTQHYRVEVDGGPITVRLLDDDAVGGTSLEVFGSDGFTGTPLCADDTAGAVNERCEVDLGEAGGALHIRVASEGDGPSTPVLGIFPSLPALTAGEPTSGTLDGENEQHFTFGVEPGAGVRAVLESEGATGGDLALRDIFGHWIVGNGFCCNPDGSRLSYFAPAQPFHELYVRVAAWDAGEQLPFELVVDASGDGSSAAEAIEAEVVSGDASSSSNDLLRKHGRRFYTFETEHSGPHDIAVSGMTWTELKSPVRWSVFADAADPAGSVVATAQGAEACEGAWVEEDWGAYYESRCPILLDAGVRYYLRLDEQDGAPESQLSMEIRGPESDVAVLTVDAAIDDSVPPQTQRQYVVAANPGSGYRVTLNPTTVAFGSVSLIRASDFGWVVSNGFCCGVDTRSSYFMPPDDAAPLFFVQVDNNDSDLDLDFSLEVVETGTGAVATSAVAYELLQASGASMNDVLDSGQARFFTFEPAQSGTFRFMLTDMDWAQVNARVEWTLFTNPNDIGASGVATTSGSSTCTPVFQNGRFEALCNASLTAGTAYYLRATEKDGEDSILYNLQIQPM